MSGKNGFIVTAGGLGRRVNSSVPKQFLPIHNKPLIVHTLQALDACSAVDEMVLVVPYEYVTRSKSLIQQWNINKISQVISGGDERQHSVVMGLQSLSDRVEYVFVHDGVRPFVPDQLLIKLIEEVRKAGAAILAVPEPYTLKESRGEWVEKTLNRTDIWQAQTPQGFRRDWFQQAVIKAEKDHITVTDDAAMLEYAGYPVKIVRGVETNIKITTPEDFLLAEAILTGLK